MSFHSIELIALAASEGVRPPERLTIAEAAEKYRRLNNKGSYVGPWRNDMAPYLVEPMNIFGRTAYTACIFVGPAQCGKTELFLNWQTFTVCCDPADLMLVQTSNTTAADFSKRRVDRLHKDSPAVGSRLLPSKNADNTFDKRYASGAMVTLSWPSINELSGKPIPRVFLTDYDRMPQDVEHNGSPFDLAQARTTTFRRHGMTVAESSPSFPITDPRWVPGSRHEAPPCEGVLSLYNRGDRRRWYWRCVDCDNAFEPDFSLLKWPDTQDHMEAAEAVWLECPYCAAKYWHDPKDGRPGKHELNGGGRWLRDGEVWTPSGEIAGTPVRSDTASFWLKGVAAAFKDWRTIILKLLAAEDEYRRTGSEDALKATVNVDHGAPYLPKSEVSDRLPEALKDRARDYGHKVVPPGVRFLVAAIDVQKNRFVVQVHGFGVGGDVWIVDRFDVRYSRRMEDDRKDQAQWVRPFAYKEDWRLLLDEAVLRTYPLGDGSGRHMAIKLTVSDSGGGEEGTANAYEFYRWLKKGPQPDDEDADDWPTWTPGLHARFQLIKGVVNRGAPRVRIDYPDSGRKGRHAEARGEIPVMFVNTNALKNQADAMLNREKSEAAGRVNFPAWLNISFFKELCVETKNIKGEWQNPRGFRNESWDLLVYGLAGALETRHVGIERIDWTEPPSWAAEWDANDLVFYPELHSSPLSAKSESGASLAELAGRLG